MRDGQTSPGTEPARDFSQVSAAPSALWLFQEIHHWVTGGGKSPLKAKANLHKLTLKRDVGIKVFLQNRMQKRNNF